MLVHWAMIAFGQVFVVMSKHGTFAVPNLGQFVPTEDVESPPGQKRSELQMEHWCSLNVFVK